MPVTQADLGSFSLAALQEWKDLVSQYGSSVAKCHGGETVLAQEHRHKYFFLLGFCCQSFAAGAQHNLLTITVESSKHNVPTTTTSEVTVRHDICVA